MGPVARTAAARIVRSLRQHYRLPLALPCKLDSLLHRNQFGTKSLAPVPHILREFVGALFGQSLVAIGRHQHRAASIVNIGEGKTHRQGRRHHPGPGFQLVQSGARYEGGYWNTTGIARPVTTEIILKKMGEVLAANVGSPAARRQARTTNLLGKLFGDGQQKEEDKDDDVVVVPEEEQEHISAAEEQQFSSRKLHPLPLLRLL